MVTCTRCEADLCDGLCPACDGALVEVDIIVGAEPDPSEVGVELARIEPATWSSAEYAAALADLADGERRWKAYAKRRTFQLEIALELVNKGMVASASAYLHRALAEATPEVRRG